MNAEGDASVPAYASRYSLEGIREATTDRHNAFIERAVEVLSHDDRIVAGYVVGGFAVGMGDAFSDVDLQCCIRDEAAEDLRSSWPLLVNQIARLVHVQPFSGPPRMPGGRPPPMPGGGPIGGLCITPEWLHFDIVFNPVSIVNPRDVVGMVPLFDKANVLPTAAVPRPDRRGDPFLPQAAVGHFLYMLGNVVSAIGRNEVIPAMNGVIMIRDVALVGLLLAEGGLATTREHVMGNPFPFTKRLRPYLTDEQNALLESLPPLVPNLDSVIDGYVALAEAFLPRAKQLAASTGAAWPSDYEQATVAYFERMVGVTLRV